MEESGVRMKGGGEKIPARGLELKQQKMPNHAQKK